MTISGINVFRRQAICKQVTNCTTYLSPFSRTVFLLIQGHYGTPSGIIFVMTSDTNSGCMSSTTGMPTLQIRTPLLQSRGNMALRSRLALQHSLLPVSILISSLPLTGSLLPSQTQQERPSSFMVLEAQARLTFTTPSAIHCAHRTRLSSVLHPLALLLFSLRVVALHTPALRSLFPAMRQPFAPYPRPPIWPG